MMEEISAAPIPSPSKTSEGYVEASFVTKNNCYTKPVERNLAPSARGVVEISLNTIMMLAKEPKK